MLSTDTTGPHVPLLNWLGAQLKPISAIGIGLVGRPSSWSGLEQHVKWITCDPLYASAAPSEVCTHRAVAVSAYGGSELLNVAADTTRSSLLEPNWATISRHGGLGDFEIVERRNIPAITLSDLDVEYGPIDALRLDCSGLEYQLLSSTLPALSSAVLIDISGGMVDNYIGQYPFPVVHTLLNGAGYTLVDLTVTSRQKYSNFGEGQPVEYRGVWLRDYIRCPENLLFFQAIKLLVLCRHFGYFNFGQELSTILNGRSLLPDEYARMLRQGDLWYAQWTIPAAAP